MGDGRLLNVADGYKTRSDRRWARGRVMGDLRDFHKFCEEYDAWTNAMLASLDFK